MKTRKYFVSNSSSSSFICCLSGGMESGMDMTFSDAGMEQCRNGHVFYEKYKLSKDEKEPTVDDYRNWYKNWCNEYEWRSKYLSDLDKSDDEFMEWFEDEMKYEFEENGIPTEQCPVCQFVDMPYAEVAKYYLKTLGITRKEFAAKMKEEFHNYENFAEFIREKK
jgi:hypothetical protein